MSLLIKRASALLSVTRNWEYCQVRRCPTDAHPRSWSRGRDHQSGEQEFYDKWDFAAARRAGDYVYVSGVVVREEPGTPRTPETLRTAARLAFMSAPHPAWTAVGTSSLIRDGGVVEIQMIAYAPQGRSPGQH